MDEKEEKRKQLEYLKGYRDAIEDTWPQVLDMATKGYLPKELQIVSKTKYSEAKHKINQAIAKLEEDIESLRPPLMPEQAPMPIMVEPELQVVLDIKPGLSYAVEETHPSKCFRLFKNEIESQRPGMAVVRKPPQQISEFSGLEIKKTIWLTKSEKNKNDHMPIGAIGLDPSDMEEDDYDYRDPSNLPRLFADISDFLNGNSHGVVLLEGIEYLISSNGFKAVLNFTNGLTEAMVRNQGTLIFSLNSQTLDDKQASLLKRDMSSTS